MHERCSQICSHILQLTQSIIIFKKPDLQQITNRVPKKKHIDQRNNGMEGNYSRGPIYAQLKETIKKFCFKIGSDFDLFQTTDLRTKCFFSLGVIQQRKQINAVEQSMFQKFVLQIDHFVYSCINIQINNKMMRKLENALCEEYTQKSGKKGNKKSGKCYFRWTEEENKAYAEALIQFQNQLKTQYHRRSNRTFYQIAQFVTTRTSEQCRTHHQKMIIKYGTVENIIKIFSKIKQEQQSQPENEAKLEDKSTDLNILIKQEEIDSFVSVRFDNGLMLQDMSFLQQKQIKANEDWLDCFNF